MVSKNRFEQPFVHYTFSELCYRTLMTQIMSERQVVPKHVAH